MKKIVFSVFIDIPENQLDNPGWYDRGVQVETNKSLETKLSLLKNYEGVKKKHKEYAEAIGADYKLYEWGIKYQEFLEMFEKDYPEISHYDVVNFYKHWVMLQLSDTYDAVCYLDFDVVPNTNESIFDAHNIDEFFGVAHSNRLAEWGKRVKPKYYNTCIRNPSTKYWNAHAMLLDQGYKPDNDVFNTGIMVASSDMIKKIGYFEGFRENLDLMTELKNDEDSMYPYNIRRVFGYDNETLFSYLIHSKDVQVEYLNGPWHYIVDEKKKNANACDPDVKLYHCINKKMEWFL